MSIAARIARRCAAFGLGAGLALALAQPAATVAERLAADLHEQVLPLTVAATDRFGRRIEGSIPITSFRPAGDGPFPLVVMNHGRGPREQRVERGRARYLPLVRYLVGKGFAVLVPTRLGYASTSALGDPEDVGSCAMPQREVMAAAAADQVQATVELARTLPWIDATRWVVMGQSVGGLTAVAVASRNPPGLAAAVNFAGGAGGRPATHPGRPCAPDRQAALWAAQAAGSRTPMLWIYWRNDQYWGEEAPRRWAQAWQRGGGTVEFHHLPPAGSDGHHGLAIDMAGWVPLVEAYLARAGFDRPGRLPRQGSAGAGNRRAVDDDASPVP